MNKKLWLWAAVGALVGAAGLQTAHVIKDRHELFGQRQRCKAFADKYAKEHSNLHYTVLVDHVEFSGSRSSCIAATAEQLGDVRDPAISWDWTYKVVDLLNGETIFMLPCSGRDECAQSLQGREKAFQKAR
jgi:hypothetical protein